MSRPGPPSDAADHQSTATRGAGRAARAARAEPRTVLEQAVQDNAAGRPARAARALRALLARLPTHLGGPGDLELRGRASVTLALALFDLGRHDSAVALLDDVDGWASQASPEVAVLSRIQRAGMHGRMGQWRATVDVLSGIDPADPALSPRGACVVELNQGLALQLLDDIRGSRRHLRRARELAARDGFDDLGFAARHNLGRLEMVAGNLPEGLRLMAEARDAGTGVRPSSASLDYGRALLEAGLIDAATPLLEEAERVCRASGLVHEAGEAVLERARAALLVGDFDTADRYAIRAARSFARRSAAPWRRQALLLALTARLAAGSPPRPIARRAQALAQEVLAECTSTLPAGTAAAEIALLAAEAWARAGNGPLARELLRGAPLSTRPPLPVRLHQSLAGALIDVAESRPDKARRRLTAAAAELAGEQARHAGIESRTGLALHAGRLRDLDVGVAVEQGDPVAIFEAVERWRGASLRPAWVDARDDPELADLLARMRAAAIEAATPRDTPAGTAAASAAAEELARLEQLVTRRDWHTARSARVSRGGMAAVNLDEFGTALAESGWGAVAIYGHAGRLGAVTVDATGARWRDVAALDAVGELRDRLAADVDTAWRAVEPRMREVVARSLRADLADMDALLAASLPTAGADAGVVVLPSPALATLPWRLLPSLASRPVLVTPSATFWTRRGQSADTVTTQRPTQVLALAGPELADAATEAEAVGRSWGDDTQVRVGPEAVGGELLTGLRERDVVHIAAHGYHHAQSPLFSRVLLADGPVFAHEFERTPIRAGHVVLSACDLGRVQGRPGDEPLGLTASLLACGVTSVVAAVSPVRDDATAAYMAAYHRHLSSGLDPAQALVRADADCGDGGLFCAFGSRWQPAGRVPSARA